VVKLTRIKTARALPGFRLRLKLTDGRVIERAVRRWMTGPVFAEVRDNPEVFACVRVEHGTVSWPNGADLCPDLVIWEGPPPGVNVAPPTKRRRGRGRPRAVPSR
jgi:hypothetical protein